MYSGIQQLYKYFSYIVIAYIRNLLVHMIIDDTLVSKNKGKNKNTNCNEQLLNIINVFLQLSKYFHLVDHLVSSFCQKKMMMRR